MENETKIRESKNYSIYRIEYETDGCKCHPETCGCDHFKLVTHEKRYNNGKVKKINHKDDYSKTYY